MAITRRHFLKRMGIGSVMLSSGLVPLEAIARGETFKLTILHTNDIHSRIEAFDSGRFKGLGGAAKRANLIKRIRAEESNVLLLDSGDIFQGTPYFNYFNGELEFKLMSKMKYDAVTLGNHDFDAGIDGLHKQLPNASFPIISSNYDFSDTLMQGKTKPYKVFQKGNVRIGVFGLGIELDGLVPAELYKNTRYQNPIKKADYYAAILKHEEKCDLIVCLSHLGYKYKGNKVSDIVLAENSKYIDIILGGHTHTLMDEPDIVKNKKGEPVIINQAYWAGIMLGRLDIHFEKNYKGRCLTCKNLLIGKS